mgnify:CR=1 FL=1
MTLGSGAFRNASQAAAASAAPAGQGGGGRRGSLCAAQPTLPQRPGGQRSPPLPAPGRGSWSVGQLANGQWRAAPQQPAQGGWARTVGAHELVVRGHGVLKALLRHGERRPLQLQASGVMVWWCERVVGGGPKHNSRRRGRTRRRRRRRTNVCRRLLPSLSPSSSSSSSSSFSSFFFLFLFGSSFSSSLLPSSSSSSSFSSSASVFCGLPWPPRTTARWCWASARACLCSLCSTCSACSAACSSPAPRAPRTPQNNN